MFSIQTRAHTIISEKQALDLCESQYLLKAKTIKPYEMQKFMTALLCICISVLLRAQNTETRNTDLQGPPSNLQTLPAGSYVIAMDNAFQRNSAGEFNLKAYGLIVYLLNNNARIKLSIKAGKVKDGIDFTALAEQIKPTLVAGGVSRNFQEFQGRAFCDRSPGYHRDQRPD
jgi:hypothetical protein